VDLTNDEQLDLAWFFGSAEGACGIRSIQGGFENAMDLKANCFEQPKSWLGVKAEVLAETQGGRIKLHERRSVRLSDDGALGRLENWERARKIHQRLARVGYRNLNVLRAAFEDTAAVDGLSVELLANQPTAIVNHKRSVEAVAKVLSNRLRRVPSIIRKNRRATKKEVEALQAEGKEPEPFDTVVPKDDRGGEWWLCEREPDTGVRKRKDSIDERRIWVLWLGAKSREEGGAKRELFETIQAEARKALELALEAFRKASKEAA